jgi:alkylhydroperoxidase/carboxymuconolactone decarboxylase family protein YurZ
MVGCVVVLIFVKAALIGVCTVKEVLLHLGIYAGVPCSNSAYKIAKKVYQELEKKGF